MPALGTVLNWHFQNPVLNQVWTRNENSVPEGQHSQGLASTEERVWWKRGIAARVSPKQESSFSLFKYRAARNTKDKLREPGVAPSSVFCILTLGIDSKDTLFFYSGTQAEMLIFIDSISSVKIQGSGTMTEIWVASVGHNHPPPQTFYLCWENLLLSVRDWNSTDVTPRLLTTPKQTVTGALLLPQM